MPSLHSLILFALITLAIAVPHHPVKRSFKIERVPNPNFKRLAGHKRSVGAGTRALIKAHQKYSVSLPPALLDIMRGGGAAGAVDDVKGAALSTGADGLLSELLGDGQKKGGEAPTATTPSAGAGSGAGAKPAPSASAKPVPSSSAGGVFSNGTSSSASNGTATSGVTTASPAPGDVEYLSPVTIGGQTMNLDFDSGSSDLWVFNSQLPANLQAGHTVYDINKSTTFKMLQGQNYTISYGDGSGCSGNVGTDIVNIGGVEVQTQAVELPTKISQSFVADTDSNGLLGLAFSKLNTVAPTQQKTFFDNALPNLKAPLFTADLRSGAVGAYEFGNIDATKFNGSLQFAAINNTRGFWQFSSSSFAVAGTTMNVPGGQAIADTGTTLMLTSAAIVNAYYSKVQGAVNDDTVGGVTFPCASVLPDLQVDVGGSFMATVRGTDINFAPVDATGTTCFGGVQAIQSNLQIYGDILFKSNFVVFNAGNNTIGMAPHL